MAYICEDEDGLETARYFANLLSQCNFLHYHKIEAKILDPFIAEC
jgi:hypothetical protein